MEHVIAAEVSGYVREVAVEVGDTVFEGHPLVFIEEEAEVAGGAATAEEIDLDAIRPDLAEVLERHRLTLDAGAARGGGAAAQDRPAHGARERRRPARSRHLRRVRALVARRRAAPHHR